MKIVKSSKSAGEAEKCRYRIRGKKNSIKYPKQCRRSMSFELKVGCIRRPNIFMTRKEASKCQREASTLTMKAHENPFLQDFHAKIFIAQS
jgi:hypothetical protein